PAPPFPPPAVHPFPKCGALLRRHRGQSLFHPLATLFRGHVRIESAASPATEPSAAAAVWISPPLPRPRCPASHTIAAAASFVRGSVPLTLSLTLALRLTLVLRA